MSAIEILLSECPTRITDGQEIYIKAEDGCWYLVDDNGKDDGYVQYDPLEPCPGYLQEYFEMLMTTRPVNIPINTADICSF